jgi:hypothetical protein
MNDAGQWYVRLDPAQPDPAVTQKMTVWDRVYSIKERLEHEIQEFFEDWMTEVSDDQPQPVDQEQFIALIVSAKNKAIERSQRRMVPCQIIRAAFFDFMLTKAQDSFVESFRRLANRRCA